MAISITRSSAPASHRATTALYLGAAGMLAVGGLATLDQSLAQSVPSPKFEVASIRKVEPPQPGGLPAECFGPDSPGRLRLCGRVALNFIPDAYVDYADGHRHTLPVPSLAEGGPGWAESDIVSHRRKSGIRCEPGNDARAYDESAAGGSVQAEGPSVTREVPVYELTVGKNESKLRQHLAGNCTPYVRGQPQPTPGPGEKPVCKISIFGRRGQATTVTGEFWPLEVATVALYNSRAVDRPIIDKTGLTNIFDIHLEFTNATPTVGAQSTTDSPVPSIFTALEELGLKLVPAKGPQEVIVIDHIERPSEN